MKHDDRFQKIRRACHGVTPPVSCSGWNLGSAAAWNASTASIAEAVWCPCVSAGSGEKRVMMTSGRKWRMTATTSARTASFPQMRSVSSGLFEKPKSRARVKNCSAPSMRRAASSSCVRMRPSAGPCSEPIRFWPPSPRVSDR